MKKVVTIGGGTGSFNLLSGLKHYDLDITSIVTTFDSGGSTGKLRDEFGALPAGDVRRALVALAPIREDQFLRELFQVRFDAPDSGLHNHSFGNLLLLAAERVTKDRAEGIQELSKLLSIKGRVFPVSVDDAHLRATFTDGSKVTGEAVIDAAEFGGDVAIQSICLTPEAHIYEGAARAIKEAEYIIFGPGDLYTSIIPNTLVKGFVDALKESNAKIIFITNIMSKWGETHGMAAHDHIRALLSYIEKDMIDAVFINEGSLKDDVLVRYKEQHKEMVLFDKKEVEKFAKHIVVSNFMSDADVARHNSEKVAKAVVTYIES
ncbi:MAG: uridine diphosphate-N-acetylglucosamine-binding protein YvcK [Patescibacteria group bacterium UBA2103]